MEVDPIHQFGIINLVDLGTIGGVHIAFTNSALMMGVAVLLISTFLILATGRAFLMPGTERAGGTRLEYTAPDMTTAHRTFRAMVLMARD